MRHLGWVGVTLSLIGTAGAADYVPMKGSEQAAAIVAAAPQPDRDNPLQPGATWEALKPDIFGDRPIQDGSALMVLEAPYRAHDAGLVPIEVRALPGTTTPIVRLTLVVDENPAPVAATFDFGPAMGPMALGTRVRVNAYTNVRAIAETADGALYMVGRYVKASGGCSAPALKDLDEASAALGRMKLREYPGDGVAASGALREAQVMIRHPNFSGLQLDPTSLLFIPAHFVNEFEVRQGDDLVFRMEGGISISEDPTFRFTYTDNGQATLKVHATDTEGATFDQSFALTGS